MTRFGWITAHLAAALAIAAPAQEVSSSPGLNALVTAADIPPVCATAPAMDTLIGAVGVGSPCVHRQDASSPTVIQAKDTITASDATYAVTFDRPFTTSPVYADARIYGQSQPYLCTVTATTTGATGKCFQLVATTLPLTATALLGLAISPFQAAAGSLPVRVVARQ
jgi:hypothetical protein